MPAPSKTSQRSASRTAQWHQGHGWHGWHGWAFKLWAMHACSCENLAWQHTKTALTTKVPLTEKGVVAAHDGLGRVQDAVHEHDRRAVHALPGSEGAR